MSLKAIFGWITCVLLAASLWMAVQAVRHQNEILAKITAGELETGADGDSQMKVFLWMAVCALVIGVFFVIVILPKMGDWFGGAMLGSNEEIEPIKASPALAKVAQGDYEGAVEEYQKLAEENPGDPSPVVDAARLCADKLDDPDRAIEILQTHLEGGEWDAEGAAFLMFRLAEMYTQKKGDYASARSVLEQIQETFPDTRHSANAGHELRKLEELEFAAIQSGQSPSGLGTD